MKSAGAGAWQTVGHMGLRQTYGNRQKIGIQSLQHAAGNSNHRK